ncbi:hypothetical protein RJ640_022475 [Escallonia rubra]|uniref:RING-type E3 ubiquitin transferase n=1 Tax=Escallonia rubra TaxID=112253 RepID=A0AA88RMN7_9ASTE|nr:hypothetical protein RJ640_022475 [Escallonia rubra]
MKGAKTRKLLQEGDLLRTTLSPAVTYSPDPELLPPVNGSSVKRPFKPGSPFDSSMALTVLVLLTALFFMGFFSVYIRRLAEDAAGTDELRRRRQHHGGSLRAYSTRPYPLKGLDPTVIESLPVLPYTAATKQATDCTVCLSEFEGGESVKVIPYCRHVFHPECIDRWLASHVSCPLCRSTDFGAVGEVRLGVVEEEVGCGVSGSGTGSTEEEEEGTWRVDIRRTCSCSSLGEGDRVWSLTRSTSL